MSRRILPLSRSTQSGVHCLAVDRRSGEPNLVAQHDRAAPAFIVDRRFPAEVFRFAEGDGQAGGVGDAVAVRAAEFGPGVASAGKRCSEADQECGECK